MRFVYLFLFSKSFISLPPLFFNSYIRFVYLFLSFRTVHFVVLFSFSFYSLTCASFTSSFPLRALISSRPSFRCNSTLRFVTSFLSFQLFNAVRYFSPFRFNSSLLFPIPHSFRFKLSPSLRYFLPIVSTLPSCSLSFTSFFHFTVFISLLPFLLFQCFHPVRLPLPFVSSRSFRYLLFYLFSLQLFLSVRFALPFLSNRPFHIPLTISTKRVNTCLIPFPVSWKIHAQKMESCTGFCSKRAFAASCRGVSFST